MIYKLDLFQSNSRFSITTHSLNEAKIGWGRNSMLQGRELWKNGMTLENGKEFRLRRTESTLCKMRVAERRQARGSHHTR